MNLTSPRSRFSLACLLLASLAFGAEALAEESCTSAGCHATLVAGKSVHAATDSCTDCHEAVAQPHPQPGKATFELAATEPGLCANCHDAFGGKAHGHEPVASGVCSTCHDPHAAAQPKLLLGAQEQLCGDCHSDQVGAAHLHAPVASGECTACHLPHEADTAKLLTKTGDALCFECHSDVQDAVQGRKVVHAALDEGCTSCHDPHGAAQGRLLTKAPAELCADCHGEVGDQVAAAASPHAALDDDRGCAACHAPHAADRAKLLPASERDLCVACHDDVVTRSMTVLHQPVADGECTPCHQPHGGARAKLLTADFPATPYVPYTGREFALCFECHDREQIEARESTTATAFRDGDRNLHALHVNIPDKARSCVLCHATHGSTGPSLVAESVRFGRWQLPIQLVKTETGGGCAPGCHKPAYYDRETPGRRPAPTAPRR